MSAARPISFTLDIYDVQNIPSTEDMEKALEEFIERQECVEHRPMVLIDKDDR